MAGEPGAGFARLGTWRSPCPIRLWFRRLLLGALTAAEAIAGTSLIARYLAHTREPVATKRTQQHLEASSRYEALVADRRVCMNDQGLSFDRPTDAEDVVHRRVGPLLASAGGDAAAMENELADVARFETGVAVVDHDCGGSEIDEVYQSIFRETLVDVARELGEL